VLIFLQLFCDFEIGYLKSQKNQLQYNIFISLFDWVMAIFALYFSKKQRYKSISQVLANIGGL